LAGLLGELARRVYQGNDLGRAPSGLGRRRHQPGARRTQGPRHQLLFRHTEAARARGTKSCTWAWPAKRASALEAQIVMGKKPRRQAKDKPFKDQRSAAAGLRRRAANQTRPVPGDAPAGAPDGLPGRLCPGRRLVRVQREHRACLENHLTAIMQMKRGFSLSLPRTRYTVYQLYGKSSGMRPAHRRARFKTAAWSWS